MNSTQLKDTIRRKLSQINTNNETDDIEYNNIELNNAQFLDAIIRLANVRVSYYYFFNIYIA